MDINNIPLWLLKIVVCYLHRLMHCEVKNGQSRVLQAKMKTHVPSQVRRYIVGSKCIVVGCFMTHKVLNDISIKYLSFPLWLYVLIHGSYLQWQSSAE